MLHLVTGVPGATKTAFVMTKLDKMERDNKINLAKNIEIYKHNLPLLEKFANDFSVYQYEVGAGHKLQIKNEILDDDYFTILGQEFDDLRPDDYYKRAVRFNEIALKITEQDGDQGFKQFLPVRTIYTNISACKIDFARALTYDWRECPDGSLIVIDEVQLLEPYSDTKDKSNPIIQDLTVHRHRGFDFYFITQYPSLLHPTVKVLVGVHYHLTRPYGMKTVVYQYGSAKDNPNALVNKMNREARFMFTPQQRIFKLYKSTTIDTHKKRFPKGIIVFLIWIIAAIAFFLYTIFGDNIKKSSFVDGKDNGKTQAQTKTTATNNKIDNPMQKENEQTETQAEFERIKLEYEQLKQIQFYKEQIAIMNMYNQRFAQDYEIQRKDPNLAVAGVIAIGDKCQAINRNGQTMNLPTDECLYYTKDFGRVMKTDAQIAAEHATTLYDKPVQITEPNATQEKPSQGYTIEYKPDPNLPPL